MAERRRSEIEGHQGSLCYKNSNSTALDLYSVPGTVLSDFHALSALIHTKPV